MHEINGLPDEVQQQNIDPLDFEIIKLLQQDGRAGYSYIARVLEIPEATARYRVRRLIDDEIISVNAFVKFEKLSSKNIICVEMDVNEEFFDSNLESLINLENINFLSITTSEFNILLDYIYESNDDLINFLLWLKKQKGVNRIQNKVILKVCKSQYPFRIPTVPDSRAK